MTDITRRKLLSVMGTGAALIPVSALIASLPSRARADEALPMVDPSSAQAQALEYVAVSTTDGQTCSNCILYQGDVTTEAAQCPLFSGSMVAGPGWCNAWAAKS